MAQRKKKDAAVPRAASTGIGPPDLAWRLAQSLPLLKRRELALQLIESDAEEIVFWRDGFLWTSFVWDRIIGGSLFVNGGFQRDDIKALVGWMKRHRRLARARDVIVNVGANIGTSALLFARRTHCRVLAIEPVPELHAMLCRNIAANGLAPRVQPIAAAITAGRARTVRMTLPSENSGAAEVVRPGRQASFTGILPIRRHVRVPAIGLGAMLAEQGIEPGRVAFVWADVQGSEADVIASALQLWAAGVPLFCEVDPKLWPNSGDPEAFLRLVQRYFSHFIPAEILRGKEPAQARPVSEFPAFCQSLPKDGSDALLLPRGGLRGNRG